MSPTRFASSGHARLKVVRSSGFASATSELCSDVAVVLVHQDREQFVPDLTARLVVRVPSSAASNASAQLLALSYVGPVGLDRHGLDGRLP
jgi:hypothetical protein